MVTRSGESVDEFRARTALATALGHLDPSWLILVDLRINGPTDATAADYVMLHSRFGIALIDVILARTGDPPERLRKCLADEGFFQHFPGSLPIVRLVLRPADAASFGQQVLAAFGEVPPITIADPNWVAAINSLLVPTAPRPSAPPPSPQQQKSLRHDEEQEVIPERWPDQMAGATPLERPAQPLHTERSIMDREIAPAFLPEGEPLPPYASEQLSGSSAKTSAELSPRWTAAEVEAAPRNAAEYTSTADPLEDRAAPQPGARPDPGARQTPRWRATEVAAFIRALTAQRNGAAASPPTIEHAWRRAWAAAAVLFISILGSSMVWLTHGDKPGKRGSPSTFASIPRTNPDVSLVANMSLVPDVSFASDLTSAATKPVPGVEKVKIETGIHDGFGRIVFAWPEAVEYETYLDDKSLTIKFARPLTADLSRIAKQLPLYAENATMDGESTVVILLKRTLGVQSFNNKNRVAIDLLDRPKAPAADLSSPPTLAVKPAMPAAVTPAPPAKSAPAATEAPQPPPVSVRLVVEGGVRRLHFGWQEPVRFSTSVTNGEAKIRFKRPGTIDRAQLTAAVPDLAPRVGGGEGEVWVLLKLPTGGRLKAYHKDNIVILDIAPGRQARRTPDAGKPADSKPPQADELPTARNAPPALPNVSDDASALPTGAIPAPNSTAHQAL